MSAVSKIDKGGSFILEPMRPERVFTPEETNDEQRMIATMTADFIQNEIVPRDREIERQNFDLLVRYLRKAGELGLLGAEMPEAYGGSDLDQVSSTLITENMARGSSFALSLGAHVGIGSLPIVLYGTIEQKQKYLPDLASGMKIGAYCLTEPSSGSDALGAKTTATLSPDGTHYVLNGTKQYITNAGFADVFIVYAKVDGDKFTAFIVERDAPGVSTGLEEKKMGIRGSSTRSLILEDALVPVENVLGEVGKGHKIAFNILNAGRFKLAAGCVGACKWAIELSVQYARERRQFNRSIAEFPLIQKKLADMAIRTYATESIVYRAAGLIDAYKRQRRDHDGDAARMTAQALEEYAMECSINKVFASEALDFVADEGVQIHGGYGYTEDYAIERIYRDARINRIFEGTNEINRLLIPAILMRKAMKGEIALLSAAERLRRELIEYVPPRFEENERLEQAEAMIDAAKKLFLMVGGAAIERYRNELEERQEIVEHLANMMIEIYAMESVCARTIKAVESFGLEKAEQKMDLTVAFVRESFDKMEKMGVEVITAVAEGDARRTQLSMIRKLARFERADLIPIKRDIARRLIEAGKYVV